MSASLRIALAATGIAAGWLSPAPSRAAAPDANACVRHALEAAARSGLPADLIVRVMRAESRGRPRAVSSRGAIGCMQIIPATWAYLTRRYALGNNPFDPQMNMIGGALYLAELARQFGFPGAYSAYNAGPGRYLRYVRGEAPLPAETIVYAAQIIGGGATPSRSPVARQVPAARWQEASLFVERPAPSIDTERPDRPAHMAPAETARSASGLFPLARPSDTP